MKELTDVKTLALGAGTGALVSVMLSDARGAQAQFNAAKQGAFVGVGLVLLGFLLRRAS